MASTRASQRSLLTVTVLLVAAACAAPAQATHARPETCGCSLFGTVVRMGDADMLHPTVPAALAFHYVDDGDGSFSPGEAAYLSADFVVGTGDVRLTGASGSVVQPGDDDVSEALVVLPGALRFVDANGDAIYGAGDPVYWDTGGSGAVSAADIRLTPTRGGAAGTVVRLGDADANDPLAPFGFVQVGFVDADGNAIFNRGDVAYLLFGFFQVVVGSVRLSGAPTELSAEPVVNLGSAPVGLVTPAFRATLSSLVTGQPIQGATVGFYVDGQLLCSAPTDGAGTAACGSAVEKAVAVAAGGYTARFAGSFPHCGAEGTGRIL